jgi:riboflavin synthase
MFTGIIEEIGRVKQVSISGDGASITIEAEKVLEDVKIGDSIAANGICLTVTQFSSSCFQVDVMAETFRRSNLKSIKAGHLINLERALTLNSRLGGHMVSGHIDGVGLISHLEKESNALWFTINTPPELLKYIIKKGSIAVDGVSLTVAHVDEKSFRISMIPHTRDITILADKKTGELVNLECDMIGKYVEKLMLYKKEAETEKKDISMEFLSKYGFAK